MFSKYQIGCRKPKLRMAPSYVLDSLEPTVSRFSLFTRISHERRRMEGLYNPRNPKFPRPANPI